MFLNDDFKDFAIIHTQKEMICYSTVISDSSYLCFVYIKYKLDLGNYIVDNDISLSTYTIK